jgi:hypothetical protein
MRLLSLFALLPLVVLGQERAMHTVDSDSVAVFRTQRTIAFDAESYRGQPWAYPWYETELEACKATADCFVIGGAGGVARFAYLATEVYPDDRLVKIEIMAGLDHFSHPMQHIYYSDYFIVAREWSGELYFLFGAPIWAIRRSEEHEYVSNAEFIESLQLEALVQDIVDFDCHFLGNGIPEYRMSDLSRDNANVVLEGDRLCATRGVFVDDMLRHLRGTDP